MLFVHENWDKAGIMEKIKQRASMRNLEDLSVGPLLSWNNESIQKHMNEVLKIPGAKLLFGGQPLKNHEIPECYGGNFLN